jgi:hypothetical protein
MPIARLTTIQSGNSPRTKGTDSAFVKLTRERQHLASVATPNGPFQQATILVELNNIS